MDTDGNISLQEVTTESKRSPNVKYDTHSIQQNQPAVNTIKNNKVTNKSKEK